ncbi:MAG TPA: prolipoprotein diacylglyceryl transferase [Candidatus Nitrosotalea sp.]|nr:prolipoprotein diacylglyceryl transferase [Candidatus Nitrosotalea sp.]
MHKIAFQLGNFTIYWYGVFLAVGIVAGLWTASRRAERAGIASEKILDLGPWLIVGTIIGARLLYVVSYWDRDFADKPIWEILMIRHGGLVYYGGFIGASLACILYTRIRNIPLWKTADVLAPGIALGYFFGRFGCLMNGCCYGRPTDLPWAIQFPKDHETHGVPVHPTQVYDSLLNLGLYAGLAWLFRHRKFDGQVFAAYLISYAILRGFVELFRGDYPTYYLGGWATPAHLVSAGILVAGLCLWRFLAPPRSPAPAGKP